mmetsp:Transcript_15880/g.43320  ORF Transcript_15880/g.43320 Transcript_15880/m.43320 type:complete len:228 (-) Transcript_15880:555-1238(-)
MAKSLDECAVRNDVGRAPLCDHLPEEASRVGRVTHPTTRIEKRVERHHIGHSSRKLHLVVVLQGRNTVLAPREAGDHHAVCDGSGLRAQVLAEHGFHLADEVLRRVDGVATHKHLNHVNIQLLILGSILLGCFAPQAPCCLELVCQAVGLYEITQCVRTAMLRRLPSGTVDQTQGKGRSPYVPEVQQCLQHGTDQNLVYSHRVLRHKSQNTIHATTVLACFAAHATK